MDIWKYGWTIALGLTSLAGSVRGEITALSVQQAVVTGQQAYAAGDSVRVDYTLPAAATATITVYADLPLGIGERWYAHASTQVAQFKQSQVKGAQFFEFKLDQIKAPTTPHPQARENLPPAPLKPGDVGALPGTYVIEVAAEKDVAHVSLRLLPPGAPMPASRAGEFVSAGESHPQVFMGAVRDSKGNLVVADNRAWRGRRYSPSFRLEQNYPETALGQSADPAWCVDVAVDSKDNVYLATRNGVYKYDSKGNHSPWSADDDYLKCPYPSSTKNLLGVYLNPEVKGKQRIVYGPGGGGAGTKEYDSAAVINQPGFAFGWAGLAIDAQDRVYLARAQPTPEVQVFEPSGKFIRRLALPPQTEPLAMRFGKDGALWIATGELLRLNPQTGAVEKKLNVAARLIHIGPDGTIFAIHGPTITRLTAAGEPLSFTAKTSQIREAGRQLYLGPEAGQTESTPGISARVSGLAVTARNDLLVFCQDGRVMRFSTAGEFLPDTPAVAFASHETGNVFVDNQPAEVDVQFTNLGAAPSEVTFSAIIRDLDGKLLAKAEAQQIVPPMTSLARTLSLGDAKPLGYYTIELTSRSGDREVAATTFYGGRVVGRGNTFAKYSVFGAQRMERNPEVLRRAGGGLNNNNDPVYWDSNEPKPGEWHLQRNTVWDFFRAHAQPEIAILGYGEPWFNGGLFNCRIASYDTFWNYVATVVSHYRGGPMFWRCWNEPNFFWHAAGPFSYEHYVIALQGTYAIAKAIDPETPLLCDGFAGSAREMEGLAKMGATNFTEGVPIHYPGATTHSWDNISLEGTVESKTPMVKELVTIRDQYFPGQPILNTEEGLWGVESRTPRLGAEMLPRIYISQMAVGVDRLTWFMAFSAETDDPTYLLREAEEGPWQAYFAYATASRFLENAIYVGALSDGLAQVQVFAVKGEPVIAAWSLQDKREFSLEAFAKKVTVTDWQGNQQEVRPKDGKITLQLGPSVQYVHGCGIGVLADLAKRRVQELSDRPGPRVAPSPGTPETPMPLNSLYYSARAAEIKALLPDTTKGDPAAASRALERAVAALRHREAEGAYLRNAHTALQIARRTAYFAALDPASDYAARLAPFVQEAARQVELNANAEKLSYTGVMLRVALDTSELRKKTPADQPLDEKFNPQIRKRAGETVELEMTVYNWTSGPLRGRILPVLPKGWKAAQEGFDYNVEPRKFNRFTTTVTIPKDAAAEIYPIGAGTSYKGTEQRELHPYRVEVAP